MKEIKSEKIIHSIDSLSDIEVLHMAAELLKRYKIKISKSEKIIQSIDSLSEIERLNLLAELMKRFKTKNPMEFIQNTVCNELQISPVLLKSRSREQNIAFARQLTMYLARTTTDLSLETIGSHLGGRDHATVLFACKKIEKLMDENPGIKYLIHTLTTQLTA